MDIQIKENVESGIYKIDVPLYNRSGECLGIDYDGKQILIRNVSVFQAQRMIREIEQYISDKESYINQSVK